MHSRFDARDRPGTAIARSWCAAVGLTVIASASAVAAPDDASELLSHRGVYALNLASSTSNSSVTAVDGLLEYEWKDSCDGWITNYKAAMRFSKVEGNDVDVGWTLNSWESKDGLSYRFFMKRIEGAKVVQQLRGRAKLESPGGPGVAYFKQPEEKTFKLAPGTLFPTTHMLRVISQAESGSRVFWADLFDGTELKGAFGLNAIIGDQIAPDTAADFKSPLFEGRPSWHMRLAFFELEDSAAEPTSEQAFRLFANGVIDDLTIDHGEYSIGAKLESLEALPVPDC
jgi:hypothetical protein